ncbi:MAG: hypothetical protein PHO02_05790 [Candidatus Nanoarchaeia archaeon]|nr:hypothetical protein [Candidatus Nanoarchaeia archaeon]
MACKCENSGHECKGDCSCGGKSTPLQKKAMATAVDQFHKWDDMVFKGIDGIPPLVNVEMSAYTMDFFMRENQLLQLLFTSEPKNFVRADMNMATVLYDRDKLVGIAIEYGNKERAFISMDKLDKSKFLGLPDWQEEPERHASAMRTRIEECTGRYIGLVKCADLMGFFGGLNRVVENENTLEMLLDGVKFACNCVAYGHLSIQPEPKFFSYLKLLNNLTDKMDSKNLAEKINSKLPDFAMGLVLQNKKGEFAAVDLYSTDHQLGFNDFGDLGLFTGIPLKEVAPALKKITEETFAVGLSTDFLYNAMHAALTYSPLKLGKAVFNAVRKGEIVLC